MSLLEVSHLKKSYNGRPAVEDLTFSVEKGEIFGLLGPNGAGKSTAMMMVAGLRQPDEGAVSIAGHSLSASLLERSRVLGLVPQELAIYPDLTGRENLQFFGQVYGLRGSGLRKRVDEVLQLTGLCVHADQHVRTYSGGMKRRLNFGAGLIHEPQVIILDEPTVGVDTQSRSHLLDAVQRLAASGVAVIYASHYMEEAEAICHRVGIIDRGRLLKCGRPEDLLDTAHSNVQVRVHLPAGAGATLRGLPGVESLEGNEARIVVRREREDTPAGILKRLSALFERLATVGAELIAIESREHNLEQLFLDLTGRRLRE
jgi:ABC-2 type transport system ATP-binding protein